jgi:3-deoxy-7-phosphoheptulonate synthase
MVIVMSPQATEEQIQGVIARITEKRLDIHRSTGQIRTILGVVGKTTMVDPRDFELLPGVSEVVRITEPYKLASRTFHPDPTIVTIKGVRFGSGAFTVIAGPCSVESRDQIMQSAERVAESGARGLRGGAFKPRTNPYSFQGLGEEGLVLLREAADAHDLILVTEVMDTTQIAVVSNYADMLQVGARNMHNFSFLRELGHARKPVLLKRAMSATIEEWLQAAEYLLAGGNYDVVLCERGIRTFETYTRNTMDISAIPVIHKLSHLPIIADPSHGTGRRDKVPPMACAALAAGADGLMIEVHPDPDHARSDGAQSLFPEQFEQLMHKLRQIAPLVDRTLE